MSLLSPSYFYLVPKESKYPRLQDVDVSHCLVFSGEKVDRYQFSQMGVEAKKNLVTV